MPQDAIYAATRRRDGTTPLTITKNTGSTYDKDTMTSTPTATTYSIRWFVQEPTTYSRLLRGTATQQRLGEVTFVFWKTDLDRVGLTEVDAEDKITDPDGVVYDVVSSEKFKTGLLVTATELRGR